ncbi:MAG: HesA/MoeB/ThiF family protein [Tissierellales bacterium]|nr:HesA/MoeB/ThiF family protein [Tissierellales bacterium]
MERYLRNMQMLSMEENESLSKYKVCVIGCGGLGGYIIEMLARLGIGTISAVDGETFEETNLNRQLFSTMNNLGQNKALAAKLRVNEINPLVKVNSISTNITEDNYKDILKGHDVVVDAVDDIKTRFLIQDFARELNIPMVHGAISGWYGQVSTIMPNDNTLNLIYKRAESVENKLGNPSFTPALIAAIEVSEVLKILIKRGELLRHKLLLIDTYTQSYTVVDLRNNQ